MDPLDCDARNIYLSDKDAAILRSMRIVDAVDPDAARKYRQAHARLLEDFAALHQDRDAADRTISDQQQEISGLLSGALRLRGFFGGFMAGFCIAGGLLFFALILTGRLQ